MNTIKLASSHLRELSPDKIGPNPQNPRLFFRPEEMDTLMASIRTYGIQVPITVYQDGSNFVLIDGERRWRCSIKLNLKKIPAIIQEKPTPLQNLLLMFNIHALREQWDYLTIANKLPDVIALFSQENDGREPNEQHLSELTGLTRGQIRRCRLLLDLPKKYKLQLEEELALPKNLQELSEDFFIEMERSLKTVQKRLPNAISNIDNARDVLIDKFRDKKIKNITDFRMLSKIATSVSNVGVSEKNAESAVREIFNPDSNVGIQHIFNRRFATRYDERKVSLNIDSVSDYLDWIIECEDYDQVTSELREKLFNVRNLIDVILKEGK